MNLPRVLFVLCALGLGGCASRGTAPVTHFDTQACDAQWNLRSARSLDSGDGLPLQQQFDEHSSCRIQADGKQVRYALFQLPQRGAETRLTVSSLIQGRSLFAPSVAILDVEGRVLRQWEFERFSTRGNRLNLDLFLDGVATESRERFLLVQSAANAVGEERERVVSSSFVLPILTGLVPMLLMHGTERETQYTLSHNGQVEIRVEGGRNLRRALPAQDMMRAELRGF